MNTTTRGWLHGLLGVLIFSGSLPATRVAVLAFEPVFLTAIRAAPATLQGIALPAWLGLAYVSVFSMLVGFVFWYKGLAEGGVAAVSQLQLLQPFFGMVLASALLNEPVTWPMLATALGVIACVAGARRFAR